MNNVGVGVSNPYTFKNSHISLQSALHTCGSMSMDATDWFMEYCSTYCLKKKKNLGMSEPIPFELMLFKGQL